MKSTIRISLRAGEKIYINAAVLRPDRKVSLELLNDVTFLLENHVLQAEDTTTPLRQLYFAAQIRLINPDIRDEARKTFKHMMSLLLATFENKEVLKELKLIDEMVHNGKIFAALKAIRSLYPIEQKILEGGNAPSIPSLSQIKTMLEARP